MYLAGPAEEEEEEEVTKKEKKRKREKERKRKREKEKKRKEEKERKRKKEKEKEIERRYALVRQMCFVESVRFGAQTLFGEPSQGSHFRVCDATDEEHHGHLRRALGLCLFLL